MRFASTRHAMGRGSLTVLFLVLTPGCISYMASTSGGRREARRECLAALREAGLTVLQIGEADFRGAGRYEVRLTVEKEGTPAHAVMCVYDFREGKTEIRDVKP